MDDISKNAKQYYRKASRDFSGLNARVLVVEDNISNQKVTRGLLQKLGIHVEVAGNGKEAVKMLQKIPFDLVLMDCQMPVMNGFEATLAIRDSSSSVLDRKIPVIALTANAMQSDREHCQAVGMDDFLSKPIDFFSLHKVIQHWLTNPVNSDEKVSDSENETSTVVTESPVIASGHDEKLFDYADLLNRMDNDEEVIPLVVEAFLQDIPDRIEPLKAAIKTADFNQITQIAHNIKGTAANVSAKALSSFSINIEQAARSGDLDTIVEIFPDFEECFIQLKSILEKLLK